MRKLPGRIRYGLRQFRLAPVFTAAAVLTLALGIGGATAIFTLIDAVMLRSLPVSDPGRLYRVGDGDACCAQSGPQDDWGMFSFPLYQRLQAAAPEFFYAANNANGSNPIAAVDGVTQGGVGDPAKLGDGFALAYPGETLQIYATGFGITNPAFTPGQLPPTGAQVSGMTVAMDGNPIAKPVTVPGLWLGTAERISAIVEMNHPGVWIMGDTVNDDREHGMGIVVEYAGRTGKPQWIAPAPFKWNYAQFSNAGGQVQAPDQIFEVTFAKQNAADNGFNRWTINGIALAEDHMQPMFRVQQGKRYRLRMRNASDDIHPVHLHRHSFELTRVAGQPTSGIMKDVVMAGGYQEVEVDFVANNPGLTLFHCHQQLHMDFGFMALFEYT